MQLAIGMILTGCIWIPVIIYCSHQKKKVERRYNKPKLKLSSEVERLLEMDTVDMN